MKLSIVPLVRLAQEDTEKGLCPFCDEPIPDVKYRPDGGQIGSKRVICDDPECKREYQREYQRWWRKLR